MPVCMNCGKEVIGGKKFCPECNAPVGNESIEAQGLRRQLYAGEIRKCPKCGDELPPFTAVCPSCGFELRNTKVSNAVQMLASDIAKITCSRHNLEDNSAISVMDKSIANIIRNFPIPNNREDIVEFMILASSNIETNVVDISSQKEVSEAWIAKFEQAYQKAQFTLKDSPDFQSIKDIYDKKKREIRRGKAKVARRKVLYLLRRLFSNNVVRIAFLVIVLIACAVIFIPSDYISNQEALIIDDRVGVPLSSSDIEKQNYEIILRQFEDAGFTNIQVEKLEDLVTGWLTKDGQIEQVTIDGDASFSKNHKYEKDAKVTIIYHTFPEK